MVVLASRNFVALILAFFTSNSWSFNSKILPTRNTFRQQKSLGQLSYRMTETSDGDLNNADSTLAYMSTFKDKEEKLNRQSNVRNEDEGGEQRNNQQKYVDLHGLEDLEPLERKMLRMEGFEPYVLVSVLSATASYATINDIVVFDHGHIDIASATLLASSTVSTVCGTYAAVIFSMTILYGKTALGLDREKAYYSFMDATGLQRIRGFKAFAFSLSLFIVDIFLLAISKLEEGETQILAAIVGLIVSIIGWTEFHTILEGAACIFIDEESKDESEEK